METDNVTPSQFADKAQNVAGQVKEGVQNAASATVDMANKAASKAKEYASTATDIVKEYASKAADMSSETVETTGAFVRKYPIATAIGALFVGFITSEMFRKRS